MSMSFEDLAFIQAHNGLGDEPLRELDTFDGGLGCGPACCAACARGGACTGCPVGGVPGTSAGMAGLGGSDRAIDADKAAVTKMVNLFQSTGDEQAKKNAMAVLSRFAPWADSSWTPEVFGGWDTYQNLIQRLGGLTFWESNPNVTAAAESIRRLTPVVGSVTDPVGGRTGVPSRDKGPVDTAVDFWGEEVAKLKGDTDWGWWLKVGVGLGALALGAKAIGETRKLVRGNPRRSKRSW